MIARQGLPAPGACPRVRAVCRQLRVFAALGQPAARARCELSGGHLVVAVLSTHVDGARAGGATWWHRGGEALRTAVPRRETNGFDPARAIADARRSRHAADSTQCIPPNGQVDHTTAVRCGNGGRAAPRHHTPPSGGHRNIGTAAPTARRGQTLEPAGLADGATGILSRSAPLPSERPHSATSSAPQPRTTPKAARPREGPAGTVAYRVERSNPGRRGERRRPEPRAPIGRQRTPRVGGEWGTQRARTCRPRDLAGARGRSPRGHRAPSTSKPPGSRCGARSVQKLRLPSSRNSMLHRHLRARSRKIEEILRER